MEQEDNINYMFYLSIYLSIHSKTNRVAKMLGPVSGIITFIYIFLKMHKTVKTFHIIQH